MSSNAKNVGVGKPKLTGSVYRAPLGTTPPQNAYEDLDAAFEEMGYAADDGLTNANEIESDDIKAWGGQVVASPITGKSDKFTIKLIEVLNTAVLKAIYGEDAVTGDLVHGVAVAVGMDTPEAGIWVFDMEINDAYVRVVLPYAKLAELGDIVYKDDELVGFEATFSALPDESKKTHYEYIINKSSVSE